MQITLIALGKHTSFTTYTDSHQIENLVQQRKKLKNNINGVKVPDGAINTWILYSIHLQKMHSWKRKVSKTGTDNVVKGTIWPYYKKILKWISDNMRQASDNDILSVSAKNSYVHSVVWQEFSAKKHIKEGSCFWLLL